MAITVSHNNNAGAVSTVNFINVFNTFLLANSSRFTVVDSAGLDADHGWLVFKLADEGVPWQMFIGASSTRWGGSNGTTPSVSSGVTYLQLAFSPEGGWAASDAPDGAFFSNKSSGASYNFRYATGVSGHNISSSVDPTRFTVIDDPVVGYCYVLIDILADGTWGLMFGAVPLDSNTPTEDPNSYIMVAGGTVIGASSGNALYTTGDSSTNASAVYLPGNSTQGRVIAEIPTIFNSSNQPHPLTLKYDTAPIVIRCATTGIAHIKGVIKTSAMRCCYSGLTNRQLLSDGAWIHANTASGILLPWDPNTGI